MSFGSSRPLVQKWPKFALTVVIVLVLCVQMLAVLPSGVRAGAPGNWTIQTADGVGNVGQYTSLAIGSNGKQYISYYDVTNRDLRYATNAGGS